MILLIGATGFTGSHVLAQYLAAGVKPRCLVRQPVAAAELRMAGLDVVEGDLGDEQSLVRAMSGIKTLVNTASIGFGHAPALVSIAEVQGVSRAVFVSTTAIFTSLNARSKTVRVAAEEKIQSSRLQYTILRPTMIYGSSRDRNMTRLIRLVRRSPVIPVFGAGDKLQQPVYVGDVARAIVAAANAPAAARRAYNIAGAAPLTYVEVVDTIARLLGVKRIKVKIPVRPLLAGLRAAERIGIRLPLKSEQILRLNEDKSFDYSDAARDLAYSPIRFEEGIRLELVEMYPGTYGAV